MLITMLLFYFCTISPNAGGGTSDTGNAKVAAIIHKPAGDRAANIPVTICPAGYYSSASADSGEKRELYVRTTHTDDTGYFGIDTIESGDYFIEVNDGTANAVLFRVSILPVKDSTVRLEDTLKPYAGIEGNVGRAEDSTVERFLVVYGLERCVQVKHDGSFSLDNLPPGTFSFRIISSDTSYSPIDLKEVVLYSGKKSPIIIKDSADTLTESIHSAEIILNTTSDGAGVGRDVYDFPVLVRLTGDNFGFLEAKDDGSDIRFAKKDGTPLVFDFEYWDPVRHTAAVWVSVDTIYGNSDSQSFLMMWGNTADIAVVRKSAVFDTARGFFACYHFSGNVEDATPNRFHGVNYGSADAANGLIGRARSFDGVSQYISLGDLPDRPAGTLFCWFKPAATVSSSTSKTQGIWGKKESDDVNFSLSLSGTDFFISKDFNASYGYGKLISKLEQPRVGYYLVSTTTPFNAGKWYFAAWSWGDGGDSLYVNGILEASTQNSLTVSANASEEIGRNVFDYNNVPGGGPRYFSGLIDEFRIDKTCRSAAWIKLCYMNQRPDDKLVRVKRIESKM